jgi:hypothetical protein
MLSIVGETATLAHGYTMADIEALTRRALVASRQSRFSLDASDRWDYAWHAIVEELYSSEQAPDPRDLVRTAGRALATAVKDDMHHRGIDHNTYAPAPFALKYWIPPTVAATDGFTERLIEHTALFQILGQLSGAQYEAVAALAVHGNARAAAAAIGLSEGGLHKRLGSARSRFLELWFEHETPPSRPIAPGFCRAGHALAEHGCDASDGRRRCGLCARNNSRRHRARVGQPQAPDAA